MEKDNEEIMFPAVAMRGFVCFPRFVMHFDVAREISINAVEEAIRGDRLIFLTAQKDAFTEEPGKDDLYKTGVVAEIRQTLKTPDNVMRVLVEGLYRAKIKSIDIDSDMIRCSVKKLPDYSQAKPDPIELEAIVRSVKAVFERYCELVPRMPRELMNSVLGQENPYKLFENIAYNMNLDVSDKQMLLEESNILSRLGMLYGNMVHEVEVLEIEREIHEEVRNNLDKNQREY
ncbi:MAG: LON peptidase substrate-binding domain-containing protein, partial [Porcipelethomonas sp.]